MTLGNYAAVVYEDRSRPFKGVLGICRVCGLGYGGRMTENQMEKP